jgi:hypothetical protein
MVALARRYTADEWRRAAFHAATQRVDDACVALAALAHIDGSGAGR